MQGPGASSEPGGRDPRPDGYRTAHTKERLPALRHPAATGGSGRIAPGPLRRVQRAVPATPPSSPRSASPPARALPASLAEPASPGKCSSTVGRHGRRTAAPPASPHAQRGTPATCCRRTSRPIHPTPPSRFSSRLMTSMSYTPKRVSRATRALPWTRPPLPLRQSERRLLRTPLSLASASSTALVSRTVEQYLSGTNTPNNATIIRTWRSGSRGSRRRPTGSRSSDSTRGGSSRSRSHPRETPGRSR